MTATQSPKAGRPAGTVVSGPPFLGLFEIVLGGMRMLGAYQGGCQWVLALTSWSGEKYDPRQDSGATTGVGMGPAGIDSYIGWSRYCCSPSSSSAQCSIMLPSAYGAAGGRGTTW